jgi:hypothetical protein
MAKTTEVGFGSRRLVRDGKEWTWCCRLAPRRLTCDACRLPIYRWDPYVEVGYGKYHPVCARQQWPEIGG